MVKEMKMKTQRLKPIPKSKLPKGWGLSAHWKPNPEKIYKEPKFGEMWSYKPYKEGRSEVTVVTVFTDLEKRGYGVELKGDVDTWLASEFSKTPSQANRIALKFMKDINKGR